MARPKKFNPSIEEFKRICETCKGEIPKIAIEYAVKYETVMRYINDNNLADYRLGIYNMGGHHRQPVENVEYAFKMTGGNIVKSAEMLKMSPDAITELDSLQAR